MLTLTLSHARCDSLRELMGGLAESYRRTFAGRGGRVARQLLRYYVRAVDVTWGEHGWHPHLHCLAFHSSDDVDADLLGARWSDAVADVLGEERRPLVPGPGCHWLADPSRVDYLCKLGLELSDIGGSKGAHDGHYTHWQIARLASAAYEHRKLAEAHPLARDRKWIALWREWVSASKGRRHLTWSRGARKLIRDLEPVADPEERPRWVARMSNVTWRMLTYRKFGVGMKPSDFQRETNGERLSQVLSVWGADVRDLGEQTLLFGGSSTPIMVRVFEVELGHAYLREDSCWDGYTHIPSESVHHGSSQSADVFGC
jgi:hypothetical protein